MAARKSHSMAKSFHHLSFLATQESFCHIIFFPPGQQCPHHVACSDKIEQNFSSTVKSAVIQYGADANSIFIYIYNITRIAVPGEEEKENQNGHSWNNAECVAFYWPETQQLVGHDKTKGNPEPTILKIIKKNAQKMQSFGANQ